MRNNAQNPAEFSQSSTTSYNSLFDLVKRTPQGNRLICKDLTFDQAKCLLAELPSVVVVKFSKMEAAL